MVATPLDLPLLSYASEAVLRGPTVEVKSSCERVRVRVSGHVGVMRIPPPISFRPPAVEGRSRSWRESSKDGARLTLIWASVTSSGRLLTTILSPTTCWKGT